jgi:two-component system KDP operon response regulator KdpE
MPPASRILVVDDDDSIRFFLVETLSGEGYQVAAASSGEEALHLLRDTSFDLAILDLRLGGRADGLQVLQGISWRWPAMATVILTGHGTLESAISAIREGIDAYLLKPVAPTEVRNSVQEVLRKRQYEASSPEATGEPGFSHYGQFVVDRRRGVVSRGGEVLDLTACEYDLLVHLMKNRERAVPPQELVYVVREYECDHVQEARDIIKWYIYQLRRKVEPKPSRPRHILNVRGVGYTFKS